jgi:8-amino-7-oxononanoate synthase
MQSSLYYEKYLDYLCQQKKAHRFRTLQSGDKLSRKGYIDFSSNDYLGLCGVRELIDAANDAALRYGTGSTGSRLLSGNYDLFEEFEQRIAKDKCTETALIMNTGFQTNVSLLSTLCHSSVLGEQAILFFDKLNHASLYQGALLGGAKIVRYNHSIEMLEAKLHEYRGDSRPKFIVSETVHGLEGDVLDLNRVIELAAEHGAFLYLDEAHATGLIGKNGYGLSTTVEMKNIPHIVSGTFSKAMCCFGAYVACDNVLKEYIVNKAGGFIYSTALPPMVIGAAFAAWKKIPFFNETRERLHKYGAILRISLSKMGFNIGNSTTNIVPVILGDEESVINAKEFLMKNGVVVSAIRPPTVPLGKSCLRIAINGLHTVYDVETLVDVMAKLVDAKILSNFSK